jgi:hypothetical protein
VTDPPTRAEKKKRVTETQRIIESGKRPRNWNDSDEPLFHQRLVFVLSGLYYFSSHFNGKNEKKDEFGATTRPLRRFFSGRRHYSLRRRRLGLFVYTSYID